VGAGIASYKVYRSTNGTDFTFAGSSSSTTYIDANLTQRLYYYKIKACDSANNCGAYGSIVEETPTGKFTEPAHILAEPIVNNITTKKARISWSTDRSSDSKIALGTKSGNYSPSEIGNSDQVSSHQIDLDNLAAGTTYYYVAKWTDEDGNTGVSQEYQFTTAPAPSLKEISAQKVSLSSAIIQFTSKDATKVNVFFGKSDAFGGVQSVNTSLSESDYSVDLGGLDDGSKYYYKLVTFDADGNSYDGNTFSFTTPARPRISNIKFQPVAGEPTSTQQITWETNVPSTSSVSYGRVGSSSLDAVSLEMVTAHTMIIRDLEDDSEYDLVVQSRDKDGNLATSDSQRFRTALD
ncbi:fibronectin type III domain-containing protein, partial [Candidatus Saccharibacteria bacterium]|nr:fibronectin type III domain-containing protein [Candidatus Saccharibacteria bacterium]